MRNDSQHHSNRDYIRDNSRQDNANARDSHKSNIDNRGRNDCSAINSHHTTHGGMQRQSSTPGSEDPSHIDYKRETHGDYKKSGVIESSRRRRADSLSQRFQGKASKSLFFTGMFILSFSINNIDHFYEALIKL